MAEIAWPKGLIPYKTMFYLQPHVGGQESPLTRTRKVYGLSAPRWMARLTFRAGFGYEGDVGPHADDPAFFAARLDAFIAEMEGGLHTVRFHDFRRPRPQNYRSAYQMPTVDAAAAGASSIVVRKPARAIGPSIGDYVGGDGRPHIVTGLSTGDAMISVTPPGGAITVTIKPPLSAPIAADSALQCFEVTAPFRLVSGDDAGQNEGEHGAPIEYVLEFEEVLP